MSDHDHATTQISIGNQAYFAVVAALVPRRRGRSLKDEGRIQKIQIAMLERPRSLGWIKCDVHGYCNYNNMGVKLG